MAKRVTCDPRLLYRPDLWGEASHWISYANDRSIDLVSTLAEPGVYVIYLDGLLQYVGSSSSVRHRLSAYGITEKRWCKPGGRCRFGSMDRILVKVRYSWKVGEWLMREARLIARLSPPLNVKGLGA